MKRTISKFDEHVLRLVHHDFQGMTQKEAAFCLDVSQQTVNRAIARLKKLAPQFFPILTKHQKFVHYCITERGMTHESIARLIGSSVRTVESTVVAITKKGVKFVAPPKTINCDMGSM